MHLDSSRMQQVKNIWKNKTVLSFTIDVDWASEDAIKYCYNIIAGYGIPVTFFLTHQSNYLYNLIKQKKIEAGIHPNFLSDSIHGNSMTEVIQYCTSILPDFECFRCHRYYDSNDVTEAFYKLGVRYDSNLCTFLQILEPFIHRSGLLRFPVYFEDGAYLYHKQSLNFSQVGGRLFSVEGLAVINIHPMHMVCNTPNLAYMQDIKNKLSRHHWNTLKADDFKVLEYKEVGIRNFIQELMDFISKNNIETYTLKHLYKKIILPFEMEKAEEDE